MHPGVLYSTEYWCTHANALYNGTEEGVVWILRERCVRLGKMRGKWRDKE